MHDETKRPDEVRVPLHTRTPGAGGAAAPASEPKRWKGWRTHRIARAFLVALVAAAGVGCSTAGGGEGASPAPEPTPRWDLTGTWEGRVDAGGTPIDGALSIEQSGSLLVASFASPSLGLLAEGDGTLHEDGDVVLEMEYDLECPGRATLDGRVSEDGGALRGTVEATDCTGSVTGSFTFTR